MPRVPSTLSAEGQQTLVMGADSIEAYELPKSLVMRLANSAVRFQHKPMPDLTKRIMQLPESAKLQKETVSALVKGSTVFINYLGTSLSLAYPLAARRDLSPQPRRA